MNEYAHLRAVLGTLETLQVQVARSTDYRVTIDGNVIESILHSIQRVVRANPSVRHVPVEGGYHTSQGLPFPAECPHETWMLCAEGRICVKCHQVFSPQP